MSQANQCTVVKKHFSSSQSMSGALKTHVLPSQEANAHTAETLLWPIVKRVKECLLNEGDATLLHGEHRKLLSELQQRFRHTLATLSFKQFIAGCHINQLLDDYLGLLMIAHEYQPDADLHYEMYEQEREYYFSQQQAIGAIGAQLRYFITQL